MNKEKLIKRLRDDMADPFEKSFSEKMLEWIRADRATGRLLIKLIDDAEKGRFR